MPVTQEDCDAQRAATCKENAHRAGRQTAIRKAIARSLLYKEKGSTMSSIDTMTIMGEAFVKLAEQSPLEKISVSDIVSASGKNRKTFYYHFEDKSHLIRWIFRSDLAEVLRAHFDEEHLVYENPQEPGAMPDLPYYAFKKSGVRSLDGSGFVQALAETLQLRGAYYGKALRSVEPDGLRAYLVRLYVPAFVNDIRFILSNRSLDSANAHFLAEFYAQALVSYLASKAASPATAHDLLHDMGPFGNIIHSSIENEIKEQQLRRSL